MGLVVTQEIRLLLMHRLTLAAHHRIPARLRRASSLGSNDRDVIHPPTDCQPSPRGQARLINFDKELAKLNFKIYNHRSVSS